MSVDRLTPDELRQIANYPARLIKRYPPGATSNWDNLPFRVRHAISSRRAANHRRPTVSK